MNISDITITSIETITAFDVSDGSYLFTLDELQSATIAQSEEKTDVTGKGGRKLTSLKRNKAVTISGNNGLVSGGLMAVQTGGSFENKVTTVMWTDYLTVTSNSATTTYKAIGKIRLPMEWGSLLRRRRRMDGCHTVMKRSPMTMRRRFEVLTCYYNMDKSTKKYILI